MREAAMRLRFWRKVEQPTDRAAALASLRSLRRHPLVKPGPERTPGSANDDYWMMQGGMSGHGSA